MLVTQSNPLITVSNENRQIYFLKFLFLRLRFGTEVNEKQDSHFVGLAAFTNCSQQAVVSAEAKAQPIKRNGNLGGALAEQVLRNVYKNVIKMLFIAAAVRAVLYGLFSQRFVHHIFMVINMIYL